MTRKADELILSTIKIIFMRPATYILLDHTKNKTQQNNRTDLEQKR
jgi:hypothetical protein